jgi:hypothetical protein
MLHRSSNYRKCGMFLSWPKHFPLIGFGSFSFPLTKTRTFASINFSETLFLEYTNRRWRRILSWWQRTLDRWADIPYSGGDKVAITVSDKRCQMPSGRNVLSQTHRNKAHPVRVWESSLYKILEPLNCWVWEPRHLVGLGVCSPPVRSHLLICNFL